MICRYSQEDHVTLTKIAMARRDDPKDKFMEGAKAKFDAGMRYIIYDIMIYDLRRVYYGLHRRKSRH